jgi:thiamine pyrophosphokinase
VKAIVVAGGDAAADDAAHLADADLVIAADSGAAWLSQIGMRPDLLIGDMDSIDPALLDRLGSQGTAIERHPTDKDQSDAELAVERAVAAEASEVLVLGALGGERVDHELANLLLLADRRWEGSRLAIVRGDTTVLALRGGQRMDLSGVEGDLVTLLAVGAEATGVRTEGLRFPLGGATLQLGSSRGLSNQVEHSPASVSLERGTLLVIETRKERSR